MLTGLIEKVSTAGKSVYMFPYLEVSLCRSGSCHVIEDKCARGKLQCAPNPILQWAHWSKQQKPWAIIYRSVRTRAPQVIKDKKKKKMACHFITIKHAVGGCILIKVLSRMILFLLFVVPDGKLCRFFKSPQLQSESPSVRAKHKAQVDIKGQIDR